MVDALIFVVVLLAFVAMVATVVVGVYGGWFNR